MAFPHGGPDGNFPPPGVRNQSSATITNGTSLSAAIDLGAATLFGIQLPAAWTTANLTFQGSTDGATYANLYDSNGSEVTVTAAASQFIVMAVPPQWIGLRYLKIRSGTSGTAVNQAADRTLQIVSVI